MMGLLFFSAPTIGQQLAEYHVQEGQQWEQMPIADIDSAEERGASIEYGKEYQGQPTGECLVVSDGFVAPA